MLSARYIQQDKKQKNIGDETKTDEARSFSIEQAYDCIPQNTPTGIPRGDNERRPSQVGVEFDNHQGRQQGQHLEDDEDDARLGR